MRTDIYTRVPIIEETEEHILLDAIGGRWTCRWIIDRSVNSRFGETIDAALANALLPIRTILDLRSGSNDPPAPLKRVKDDAGLVYDLNPGGRPVLSAPDFSSWEADGKVYFQGVVRSMDELKALTKRQRKRYNIPFEEIARQTQEEHKFAPALNLGIQLDSDACRCVAKMVCNLFGTTHAEPFLRDEFNPIRDFVHKGMGNVRDFVQINVTPVSIDAASALGPLDHLLLVRGDAMTGEVRALVSLYKHLQFIVQLGRTTLDRDVVLSYRLDQIGREARKHDLQDLALIVPPLKQVTALQVETATVAAFSTLFEKIHELQEQRRRAEIVQQSITEWSESLGEGTVITEEDIRRISRTISDRILEPLFRHPH
jgi:hypothetical protein